MMRIEFILVLATRGEVHRRGYWHETIADGIREVKEETGIEVSARELIPLGVMNYEVVNETFIDREIAHTFVYPFHRSMHDFSVQIEEVSGMFKARFYDFFKLWFGRKVQIDIHGFVYFL
ncbi:hypothetical protein [Paenibacillus fonticola]|uniref:hypothetical protein n=1 Tax=Paenibacillus fonticola TaxID=379896 RepID=UPI0012F9CD7B|nr:hypothetical protein [Paenibacillus fonticola]